MRTRRLLAACHIHSDWSYDGKWPLETLAAEFGRRGWRILMMAEHDRGFTESRYLQYREACALSSSDRILVIPGIEYSDESNIVHVLVWGPVPFLGEGLPTSEVLGAVKAADGVAVLAHPSRLEAWRSFNPSWAEDICGIEFWNRKTDGWAPSQKASPLLRAMTAIPFTGMDFHDRRQLFPLTMELDILNPVTEESVLECIRAHRCHARAFGFRLSENRLDKTLPVMRVAEGGRRSLAWIYRHLKSLRTGDGH
jgi:hypothetical protein